MLFRSIKGLVVACSAMTLGIVGDAGAQERCAFELDVRSSGGVGRVQERKVTFINRTGYTRQVYWLDENGKRAKQYGGDIPAHDRLPIKTYVGHWFVVTNSNNRCLAVYGIGSETRTIVLAR